MTDYSNLPLTYEDPNRVQVPLAPPAPEPMAPTPATATPNPVQPAESKRQVDTPFPMSNMATTQTTTTAPSFGGVNVNTDVTQKLKDAQALQQAAAVTTVQANQMAATRQKEAADAQLKAQQDTKAQLDNALGAAKSQHDQAYADLQTAAKTQINPRQYIDNMGSGQKIFASIGMLLAGLGGPQSAQLAYSHITDGIQRDIQAQENNKQSAMQGAQVGLVDADRQHNNALDYFKTMGVANEAMYKTKLDGVSAYLNQVMNSPAVKNDPNSAPALQQLQASIQTKSAELAQNTWAAGAAKTVQTVQQVRMGAPGADPVSQQIMAYIPEPQRNEAYKELGDYNLAKAKMADIDSLFPQLAQKATYTERASGLLGDASKVVPTVRENTKQFEALSGPFLDKLAKDSTGRVVPQTIELLEKAMPKAGDSKETLQIKMDRMKQVIMDQTKTPILSGNKLIPPLATRSQQPAQGNSTPKISNQDAAAQQWASQNLNDPRAKSILQNLRAKGVIK